MTRIRISDRDIYRVQQANPIADVVLEHGVTLEPADNGNLKGRCPFQAETIPSFNVTPVRGSWYCFGCSEGGDVLSFTRKARELDFNAAVKYLAARADLTLTLEVAR